MHALLLGRGVDWSVDAIGISDFVVNKYRARMIGAAFASSSKKNTKRVICWHFHLVSSDCLKNLCLYSHYQYNPPLSVLCLH